jgi:hypothetical protein
MPGNLIEGIPLGSELLRGAGDAFPDCGRKDEGALGMLGPIRERIGQYRSVVQVPSEQSQPDLFVHFSNGRIYRVLPGGDFPPGSHHPTHTKTSTLDTQKHRILTPRMLDQVHHDNVEHFPRLPGLKEYKNFRFLARHCYGIDTSVEGKV